MASEPPKKEPETVTIAVTYKLALLIALALTLVSAGAAVFLAIWGPPSEPVKGLIETFSTTWKLGCGAFFGLLGGKALP